MLKKLIALLLILIVIPLTATLAEASSQSIRVLVNNVTLTTDVAPIIEAGRTLVPARAVLEALGATVGWRSDGMMNISKKSRQILLRPNNRTAFINGQQVQLDAPARIVNGRTLVPLRFISEAIGATVRWHQHSMAIEIVLLPFAKPPLQATVAPPIEATEVISAQGHRLSIGMSTNDLIRTMGEPRRREPTFYGYDWWVYFVPDGLLLAAVTDTRVVGVFTDSRMWRIAGCAPGESFNTLSSKHSLKESISFNYQQIVRTINLGSYHLLKNPIVIINERAVTFYLDTVLNREIFAIQIMDLSSFQATLRIANYRPDFDPSALTETQKRNVSAGQERIMFDLVNSFRARNNRNTLLWHTALADVAREHSLDMSTNGFFCHRSPSTGLPADRVRRANIKHFGVGENIVTLPTDSIEAHHLLLNSPGHRNNLLLKQYTHLGVGTVQNHDAQLYITQKFLRANR